MKNNIFQKMLVAMFVVGALLTVISVSAMKSASDEETFVDPSSQHQYLFNTIMNNPWREGPLYPTMLRVGWPSWSVTQKAQIMVRMREQGLITPAQAQMKNWINLPKGPVITGQ